MKTPPPEWHWQDASETIAYTQLQQACGVSSRELDELIEYGALRPATTHEEQGLFSADCVAPLRTACKLRRDYDLDLFTVALLMGYLQRIEHLEREVQMLRAHMPHHAAEPVPRRDAPELWHEPHGR